jgi:hypothetical protein
MELKKEGKKIFILYPPSVIRDELLDILVMTGFEAYVLSDHKRALKLLAIFPDSIMYINIDEGQSEQDWITYIKGIATAPYTKDCRLGILSYNPDRNLMKRCLEEMPLLCGYIQFKIGYDASVKNMLTALESNDAKGRRKYIRAGCGDDPSATVNVKGAKGIYYGRIIDISAVGIAARFEKFDVLSTNDKVKEMQLKLRGGLVLTDAVYMGKRNEDVYIFLFDVHRMNPDHANIIHRFIKVTLQKFMDNLMI